MPIADAPPAATPLADLDAELAVLGTLLNAPECVLEVASLLRPDDFYREPHALIYQHALKLSRNGGLDPIRLAATLRDAGLLERVGGSAGLLLMQETAALPGQVRHHAERVVEMAQRRAMIDAARKVQEAAADPALSPRHLATRLAAALPDRQPDGGVIEPKGLGYVGRFGPWELTLTRLRQQRGDLSGELQVCHLRPPLLGPGCLAVTRLSLVNLQARAQLAKHLSEQQAGDWLSILNTFALGVLERERRDDDLEYVGHVEPPAVEYLLHPFMQAGQPTLVFGQGGVGKSTFCAAVAVALHGGHQILPGIDVKVADCLILDYETDGAAWGRNIRAVASGVGLEPPGIAYKRCDRPLADMVEEIAAAADEVGAEVLIIDSVGHALGSTNEGSDANETAMRMFRALRKLRRTSLLVDHVKGDDVHSGGAVAKAYGSIYKSNAARSVWEFRAEREPVGSRREVALVHNKVNEGAKRATIEMALYYDGTEPGSPVTFRATRVEAPELKGAMPLAQRMRDALRAGAMSVEQLAKELGTTPSSIRSVFARDGGLRFRRLEWDGKPMIGLRDEVHEDG